jgi:hypothetical protein
MAVVYNILPRSKIPIACPEGFLPDYWVNANQLEWNPNTSGGDKKYYNARWKTKDFRTLPPEEIQLYHDRELFKKVSAMGRERAREQGAKKRKRYDETESSVQEEEQQLQERDAALQSLQQAYKKLKADHEKMAAERDQLRTELDLLRSTPPVLSTTQADQVVQSVQNVLHRKPSHLKRAPVAGDVVFYIPHEGAEKTLGKVASVDGDNRYLVNDIEGDFEGMYVGVDQIACFARLNKA